MTEQNRTTLQEAIMKLPVYSPPSKCWDSINIGLDSPVQEVVLEQAVAKLPDYAPSPQNWSEITAALDAEASVPSFREALEGLPQYPPPDVVWESISKNINRPARRFHISFLTKAAAASALLIGLWWAWPSQGEGEGFSEAYAFTQETLNSDFNPEADWEQDKQLMQKAVQEFRRDPVAQRLPDYDLLLSEWSALKTAQKEIADMMDRYGKDARLVRQMTEIERERSGLIREMIAQI